MSDVIPIDYYEPHLTGELICVKCGYRAIHTWNAKLLFKDLECPNCETIGYLIGTGQPMEQSLPNSDLEHPHNINKPGLILNFPGGENNE